MQRTHRRIMLAIFGFLMLGIAGYLFYDHMQPQSTVPLPKKFTYKIEQSASSSAHYLQSDFFNGSGSPGSDNTVYVSSLTDYLDSALNYSFIGSTVTDLNYTYKVEAIVKSTFSGKDTDAPAANAWSKKYTLLDPVSGSQKTNSLKLAPSVQIPFAEYAAEANKFRSAFNVPVNNVFAVTYTVDVNGNVNGVPFTNTQNTIISAPLDQHLYKIDVKFNKTDYQEVASTGTWQLEEIITTYDLPVAIALSMLGLFLVIFGLRKQRIKSPYQRELARIYRYNGDIIVKARRPVSLTHKTIVDLKSFDDLLSIEEETGLPIVANELGYNSTRFLITHDDTVYVYTLGGTTPKEDWKNKPETPEAPKLQLNSVTRSKPAQRPRKIM